MFGLQVEIHTASSQNGSQSADISAAFLADPEQCRAALLLAVTASRARSGGGGGALASPVAQEMLPPPPGMASAAAATAPEDASAAVPAEATRLEKLNAFVERGIISAAEAATVRNRVLAAAADPTERLSRAVERFDNSGEGEEVLSREELDAMARQFVAENSGGGDDNAGGRGTTIGGGGETRI